MNSITYLILLHNNSHHIENIVTSLKAINNISWKEYIIVDDASTDNSLIKAKNLFAQFSRVSVVSNEKYIGTSSSINKVLNIIQGDYIHLINGNEFITSESSSRLMEACKIFGTEMALYITGTIDKDGNKINNSKYHNDTVIIDEPIKDLVSNKLSLNDLGGCLISRRILEKIGGIGNGSFLHQMSLYLRASKYTKFVLIKDTLSYKAIDNNKISDKFTKYDNLCALLNFIESSKEISKKYINELYKFLWTTLWYIDKYKIKNISKYILSKYIKNNLELDEVIDLYKQHIRDLSKKIL